MATRTFIPRFGDGNRNSNGSISSSSIKSTIAASEHSEIVSSLPELLELRGSATGIDLKNLRLTRSLAAGENRSVSRGSGIEFDEVREYQAGDDIRCIDWRVSARTGKPLTKLFREEREHSVYIAVDQRPTMFFGSQSLFKSVSAAKVAALAGWSAVQAGDRCGGVICADKLHTFRSARTRHAMLQLLSALNKYNNKLNANSQSSLTLANCIDNCLSHTRAGATVIIISDFSDCTGQAASQAASQALGKLRNLARQRSVILVCISDPVEDTLPMHGLTGFSNGLQNSIANINKKFRHRYLQERIEWREQLSEAAAAAGIVLLPLCTTADPLSLFDSARTSQSGARRAKKRSTTGPRDTS